MFSNKSNLASIHSPSSIGSIDFEEANCESYLLMLVMKIQPAFLLIFGFVANLCSFAVLIQPRLRRRPTFSYLAFLSLSNAFLSIIHAFFTIIGVYFGYTLNDLSLFIFCRLLNRFLIDFLTHFSLYTLTAVDLDRVRSVTSKRTDHRRYSHGNNARQSGCTKLFLRVCLIELSFATVLFFFDLHWLTSYGYTIPDVHSNYSEDTTMCTIANLNGYSASYRKYLTSILPIIELVLFGIVPFLISVFATIIILRHVSIKYTLLSSNNKQLQQSRRRMELHVSVLLISLNCVFLLFTTPHNIFNVYVLRIHRLLDHKDESEIGLCSLATIQKSLDLLQQCYFMSTFFLYILTNKRFRGEFYRLFKCFVVLFHRDIDTNNLSTPTARRNDQIINKNNNNANNNVNQNHLVVPLRDLYGSHSSITDASQDEELSRKLNN